MSEAGELDEGEDDAVLLEDEVDDEQMALEAEARRQGWRPIEEYNGTPGKWVDAKTFIEKGKNFVPFLRADLERSRQESAGLKNEIGLLRQNVEEQAKALKDLSVFARNADAAGYKRARAELKEEMRAAVERGDTQGFDDAERKLETLEEARAEAPAVVETPPPPPRPEPRTDGVEPAVQEWVKVNPWFMTDRVLNAAMVEAHVNLQRTRPDLTTEENLRIAKEKVVKEFPGRFGTRQPAAESDSDEPRPRSRTVIPPRGGGGAPPRRTEDPFTKIPEDERAEARKQFNRIKVYDEGMTAAHYVALYLNPKDDELSLRKGKG